MIYEGEGGADIKGMWRCYASDEAYMSLLVEFIYFFSFISGEPIRLCANLDLSL